MRFAARTVIGTGHALHRLEVTVATLGCVLLMAADSRSQALPVARSTQVVKIVVPVPRPDGLLPATVQIQPTEGVSIEGAAPAAGMIDPDEIIVTAHVLATLPRGLTPAVTFKFGYPDGRWIAVDTFLETLTPIATLAEPMHPLPLLPATAMPLSTGRGVVPQPQENALAGLVYMGATDLDLRGRSEADLGLGIDLSGRVKNSALVNAVLIHGWNPGVSPVARYGMHQWRGHLRVRAPQLSVEAGEIRTETPLAGARVPVDGMSLHKNRGPVIGSVIIGKPKYFGGGWGGHLFQGTIGTVFRNGAVGLFASQLARPIAPSTVVGTVTTEESSEMVVEDLEEVGVLISRENRARAAGLETRLRFGNHHFTARGGWLELINTNNDRIGGAAASGSYSFAGTRASFNSQFRTMPGSLPGVSLAGNLMTAGSKLKLSNSVAFDARTYWSETSLPGRSSTTRGRGGAAGFEYSKEQMRLHVQGNYREAQFLATAITRSVTVGLRIPVTSASGFDAGIEYGAVNAGPRVSRMVMYRGAIHAEGEKASLMVSGSYRDYGTSSPRLSLDVSTGWALRNATFEAGAGVSRAGIFGDVANAWGTVEFPVPGGFTLLLGADYDRWSFERSPYLIFMIDDAPVSPWRFTFNVQRKLSVPLPFLK